MIVIVDDNLSNQLILKRMLESITDEPCTLFSTGIEAVKFIEHNQYDISLVIIDGNLQQPMLTKEMQGPDVAAEIIKINREITIATWSDDPKMLKRFDDISKNTSKPLLSLKKPLNKSNLSSVVKLCAQKTSTPEPGNNSNNGAFIA